MDALSITQSHEVLFETACEFFRGHGERLDKAVSELTFQDWADHDVVGVTVTVPEESATGSWLLITDTAAPRPGPLAGLAALLQNDGAVELVQHGLLPADVEVEHDSSGWMKALAKHCNAKLGADAFWFWLYDPEHNPTYLAESGWFSKTRRSASQTTDGLVPMLETFPHPFARADVLAQQEQYRSAAFRMNRATFMHFLEFGPRMHPPRPIVRRPLTAPSEPLHLQWTPTAKKMVRAMRGEGRAPKSKEAAHQKLKDKCREHCNHRKRTFPSIPAPTGEQAQVVKIWRGRRQLGRGESMALYVAWLLLSYRTIAEADSSIQLKVEGLVDVLVDRIGVAKTIEVMCTLFPIERDDLAKEASSDWYVPGWLFPPAALAPALWFQIRRWAAHVPQDAVNQAAQRMMSESDPDLRCAAALAFPDHPELWRQDVGTLRCSKDAGQKPLAERVRIASLIASATSVADAQTLLEAQPDIMPNTYEYPTLVRTLGPKAFPLIGAQRPTDPQAAYRQLVAMSVYQGPAAAEWMRAQRPLDRHGEKVVNAYIDSL